MQSFRVRKAAILAETARNGLSARRLADSTIPGDVVPTSVSAAMVEESGSEYDLNVQAPVVSKVAAKTCYTY